MVEDCVKVQEAKKQVDLPSFSKGVGKVIGTSSWFKITQARVDAFAVTTADPQWIHTSDAVRMGSPFGSPVAHGFLTLSLLPYLVAKAVPATIEGTKLAVNYGLNKVRFISPVPVGKSIRAVVKLAALDKVEQKGSQGAGIQNTYLITVEVEGSDKPALTAEWLTRVYF